MYYLQIVQGRTRSISAARVLTKREIVFLQMEGNSSFASSFQDDEPIALRSRLSVSVLEGTAFDREGGGEETVYKDESKGLEQHL